ncbi:MAG: hypothetical protein J7K04_05715, partial [Spirochaetales bacterium]|nr:hypothetical protein [Spirochaetales bacterium]
LAFTGKEDPKRKFFKDPDESIAAHFALAFVVFHNRFGFDHPLFKAFWKDNIKRQAVFISFIGRIFISGNDAKANSLLENNSESRERLKELWDWILGNFANPQLFTEFGFWINLNKNIFNVSWLVERVKRTLKRTNGVLSWDHGLTKSIAVFAKDSPADALEIVRIYLLEGGVRSSQLRMPFLIDNNWLKAFQLLYKNKKTRNGTYSLINNLIKEGGSTFWKLKEISQ